MGCRHLGWALHGPDSAAWATEENTECFATSAQPSPTRPTSTKRSDTKKLVLAVLLRQRQECLYQRFYQRLGSRWTNGEAEGGVLTSAREQSIKKLPKQLENPCEDAGLLGSIKAQTASERHNQCLTPASSPGGVKTQTQKPALLGPCRWNRDLARTGRSGLPHKTFT